ncbi:hypothetical protein ACFQYP_65070 [Nonomuraea antimicrobica]
MTTTSASPSPMPISLWAGTVASLSGTSPPGLGVQVKESAVRAERR